MSKANPALIGGFVIGALALVVIGLLVFGSAGWWTSGNRYIAYFPGSVKGLRVGAPVDFRGVTIGRVTAISVRFDTDQVSAQIPVVMELDTRQIEMTGTARPAGERPDAERLIGAGLRAQLESQSLLTGLLFVNLDFGTDGSARQVGGDQPYPEIPTIPSDLEQLQQSAGDVAMRLPDLVERLDTLLTTVDAELQASRGDVRSIVANVAAVADAVRSKTPQFDRIVADTEDATGEVRRAAATLDQMLQANSAAIGTLIGEWTTTAGSVRRMADQVNNLIAENREGLRDFTSTGLYEITGLAQDAQSMVDQITRVAEELERNPARFFFGDRGGGIRPEE